MIVIHARKPAIEESVRIGLRIRLEPNEDKVYEGFDFTYTFGIDECAISGYYNNADNGIIQEVLVNHLPPETETRMHQRIAHAGKRVDYLRTVEAEVVKLARAARPFDGMVPVQLIAHLLEQGWTL
jgi:hypothetical protein